MPAEENTGRVRRLPSEPGVDCAWHDRLVEHFGADGRGGDWGRMMRIVEQHATAIDEWKQFRWKMLGMVTLGGVVAGVLAWLIPLALKG